MIYYYLDGTKISQADFVWRVHHDGLYLAESMLGRWYVMRGDRPIFGHGGVPATLADCQRWLIETKLGAEVSE